MSQIILLNEKGAAQFLGLSIRSLQSWRLYGKGPRYLKLSGRVVRYKQSDLIDWTESKGRFSTSEKQKEVKKETILSEDFLQGYYQACEDCEEIAARMIKNVGDNDKVRRKIKTLITTVRTPKTTPND